MNIKRIFEKNNNEFDFSVNFMPKIKLREEIGGKSKELNLKNLIDDEKRSVNKCEQLG